MCTLGGKLVNPLQLSFSKVFKEKKNIYYQNNIRLILTGYIIFS